MHGHDMIYRLGNEHNLCQIRRRLSTSTSSISPNSKTSKPMDLQQILEDLQKQLITSEAALRQRTEETNYFAQVSFRNEFHMSTRITRDTFWRQELERNRQRQAALEERSGQIAAILSQVPLWKQEFIRSVHVRQTSLLASLHERPCRKYHHDTLSFPCA
jgi:hypothetical protein